MRLDEATLLLDYCADCGQSLMSDVAMFDVPEMDNYTCSRMMMWMVPREFCEFCTFNLIKVVSLSDACMT